MTEKYEFHFWHEIEPIGIDITASTLNEASIVLANNVISPLLYRLKDITDINGNDVEVPP